MVSYNCLFIGAGNLVLARQEVEAASDQEAMAKARGLFSHAAAAADKANRVEVWIEDRRVFA